MNRENIFRFNLLVSVVLHKQHIANEFAEQGVIACAGFGTNAEPIFYSTIPIIDSSGDSRNRVNLTPPMNTAVSFIQLFRCSLSLVNQTAVVEPQSGKIITVEPDIKKNVSSWLPSVPSTATTGNPVFDAVSR
jgi:hypothetical protein